MVEDIVQAGCSAQERKMDSSMITAALARLPANQREVLALKAIEGLTFFEIASICNLSINTVASRYRLSIEKMRDYLEDKA